MIEQTPLERAAKALAYEVTNDAENWTLWVEDARAVLKAARVPSAAMIEAGIGECRASWPEEECELALPAIWQAMIDAALEQPQ